MNERLWQTKEAVMSSEANILGYFDDLEDPRIEKNRKHPLMNIIGIATMGVICGAETWVDIEWYGKAKEEWLSSFLDLREGIASHDTFGRVFRWLDAEQFQRRFMTWTQTMCRLTSGQLVSIDGKKLRGSQDKRHGWEGMWLVSAWASEDCMVLDRPKWMSSPMKSQLSLNCWLTSTSGVVW
jgi:hypothetical protein